MKSPIVRSLALGLLCLGLCQPAATAWAAQATASPTLDKQEQAFIAKATADDAMQITLARVVLDHPASAQARALARQIIHDHQSIDRKLTRFSVAKPAQGRAHGTSSSDIDHARLQLGQLHGQALDQAFAKKMVQTHEQAIPLYEQAARQSQDKRLRTIARESLPLLRQHLQAAKALLKQ